jgi:hypothetical protein
MDQYFPQTTQLLVLRLEISVFEAMPSVLTVLRMLRAPNLTEIVFSSRRYGCFHTAPHLHGLWPQLDSVISILRFPNLTAVRFEAGRTSPPEEWGPRLRAQLPQLDDTGRLILVCASRHVQDLLLNLRITVSFKARHLDECWYILRLLLQWDCRIALSHNFCNATIFCASELRSGSYV